MQNRGWQVFGLAFLFRLQSYILSGGYSALSLLKVDILNVMGPAIAMTAIAGGAVKTRRARAVVFAAATVAIAMLTPIVRTTPLLNWLPDPIEWYFRPFPGRTNFTLFPWAGFVFAGAARRRLSSTAGQDRGQGRSATDRDWPRRPSWSTFLAYTGVLPAVHLRQVRVLDELSDVLLPPGRAPHAACCRSRSFGIGLPGAGKSATGVL